MFAWRLVLRTGCYPPNSRNDQIPPPAMLVPILVEISNLVSFERTNELDASIKLVAPPSPYEQIPYEKLEHCFEATMLYRAATQSLTLTALQIIAGELNALERQEFLMWADLQAQALMPLVKPERLQGERYLRTELPSFDVLSVFNL